MGVGPIGGGDGSGGTDLSFRDFVNVLSPFAPGASGEEKVRLAFAVYDFDEDGVLGESDLTELMRTLLPEETEPELIEHVVRETLYEADMDGDGALNFGEFVETVKHSDLRAKMTIRF